MELIPWYCGWHALGTPPASIFVFCGRFDASFSGGYRLSGESNYNLALLESGGGCWELESVVLNVTDRVDALQLEDARWLVSATVANRGGSW